LADSGTSIKKKEDLGNHIENCERKPVLDEDTKQLVMDLVKFDS
jgi:hypothetical protein